MEYIKLNLYGKDRKLRGKMGVYENDTVAIELLEDSGERWAVLTVNPSTAHFKPLGTVWVKTWSENKELYTLLVEQGYLMPTTIRVPCGYSEAVACVVTDKFIKFID